MYEQGLISVLKGATGRFVRRRGSGLSLFVVAALILAAPSVLASTGTGHHGRRPANRNLVRAWHPSRAGHPAARPPLSAVPSRLAGVASVHSTFVVDTATDPTSGTSCAPGHAVGTCSLRAAVAAADADTGHIDAITIPSGMTVDLSNAEQLGPLDLTNSMIINGAGATVNGEGVEVFDQYDNPAVQINGLKVTGGITTGDGGGMYCSNGTLSLFAVRFTGNVAADGGGLYTASDCQLWIDRSVFSKNVATGGLAVAPTAGANSVYAHGDGGGLYSYGSAYITRSTFGGSTDAAGNSAEEGAGIYNYDGNVGVINCLIEHNSSPSTFGYGVGLYNDEVMHVVGTKIDYNSAPYGADGVGMDVEYLTQIRNSEFSHNTAAGDNTTYGGGLYDDGDTTSLQNVTFDGNAVSPTSGESVYGGALLSYAYNLSFIGGKITNQTNGVGGQSDYIEGGAMYLDGSHATVENVAISNTNNNSLPDEYPEGGAIYINEYTTLQNMSIDGTSNKGYDVYGGAIYNDDYSTLNGLSITNTTNHATYSSGGYIAGGAIYNDGENMDIINSKTQNTMNTADTGTTTPSDSSSEVDGGVIYNDYESNVNGWSIKHTTAVAKGGAGYVYGGAIYNDESLDARNMQALGTTVQADSYVEGGLVYNDDRLYGSRFTVGNSKVSVLGGPMAGTPYADGSIMYNDSQANLVNATFANITSSVPSSSTDYLWGIENDDLLQLANTTVANDSISGPAKGTWLLFAYGSSQLSLHNSIVASSTPPRNCSTGGGSGVILSAGYNIDNGDSCGFQNVGDLQKAHPNVQPLANNGGEVLTGALPAGSPAINAGSNQGCPLQDARGVVRPQPAGGRCDIGAYEAIMPVAHTTDANAVSKVGATLHGWVNPLYQATTYYFEYGPTKAYGKRAPSPARTVGSDGSRHFEWQAISGLASGKTYHFRIVAHSALGPTVYGNDVTFTTKA